MKKTYRNPLVLAITFTATFFVLFTTASTRPLSALTVNCAAGQSVNDTIARARPGDPLTITVKGTCTEDVEIAVSDIRLRGDPNVGGTIVGTIFVNDRRIRVEDLAIRDGEWGILAFDNASFRIVNSVVEDTVSDGILLVRGAAGVVERTTVVGAGRHGINVRQGSKIDVRDHSKIRNNAEDGVRVDAAFLQLQDFTTVENNNDIQVRVQNGSNGRLQDARVSADSNRPTLAIFFNSTTFLIGGNSIVNEGVGMAIQAFLGSTLFQAVGHGVINGNIDIRRLSSAEFRNVTVTGGLEVADQSTFSLRDQSGIPGNQSVSDDVEIIRDSMARFLVFDVGDGPIIIGGAVNCRDQESSLSIEDITGDVVISGGTNCTDFNQEVPGIVVP